MTLNWSINSRFFLQLSLFAADLLQAIGAALDVKWVHQGFVQVGGFCTAQGMQPYIKCCYALLILTLGAFFSGAIQQLGETGVAMSTLVSISLTLISMIPKTVALILPPMLLPLVNQWRS